MTPTTWTHLSSQQKVSNLTSRWYKLLWHLKKMKLIWIDLICYANASHYNLIECKRLDSVYLNKSSFWWLILPLSIKSIRCLLRKMFIFIVWFLRHKNERCWTFLRPLKKLDWSNDESLFWANLSQMTRNGRKRLFGWKNKRGTERCKNAADNDNNNDDNDVNNNDGIDNGNDKDNGKVEADNCF